MADGRHFIRELALGALEGEGITDPQVSVVPSYGVPIPTISTHGLLWIIKSGSTAIEVIDGITEMLELQRSTGKGLTRTVLPILTSLGIKTGEIIPCYGDNNWPGGIFGASTNPVQVAFNVLEAIEHPEKIGSDRGKMVEKFRRLVRNDAVDKEEGQEVISILGKEL